MSKDCALGLESILRANYAIKRLSSTKYDLVITTGWAYRADCKTPIGEVVKQYILDNSDISRDLVVSLNESRDTVGDAYFCREFLSHVTVTKLEIITSGYHRMRAGKIFKAIFDDMIQLEVFGVATAACLDPEVLRRETKSLDAFYRTFDGVNLSSSAALIDVLSKKHPYYNGDVYPKIICESSAEIF